MPVNFPQWCVTGAACYLECDLGFSALHRPPHSIETLNAAAEKASIVPAYLPNCLLLKDAVRKAREWLQEAEELQVKAGVRAFPPLPLAAS